MNDEARAKRREYARNYRKKNREQINAYRRRWAKENPDKIRQYQETFWTKQVEERNEG